jgi:aminoglycoside 3-N-acetyltransferase
MPLRKTSISEIESLLRTLGVKTGDVVMAHTALFTLGKIENEVAGVYHAFRNVLGEEGTLIVPTFTWSFRRNETYNVRDSPPVNELGVFSNYVRQLPEALRSMDPLFSMAAIGPSAQVLMNRNSHNSFGKGSIYEKIFTENTLFVNLGITYSTGMSAFMHLEKLAGVDYRKDLRVEGLSVGYDGKSYDDWALHFARDEEKYPTAYTKREPLGNRMEQLGISSRIRLGSGNHISFRSYTFLEYVLNELELNPHIMLVKE